MNTQTMKAGPVDSRSKWIAGITSALVLAAAIVFSVWMVRTSPKAEQKPPVAQTPVVEAQPIVRTNQVLLLEAMGVVLPAREIRLQAEVSGRIVSVHPALKAGGLVKKGEELVRLDDRSYQATLRRQQAALQTAQSSLAIEEGQQTVARADMDLMQKVAPGQAINQALALREPQRAAAQAAVEAAAATVAAAALDLERTRILAPWDAVVLESGAETGGQASPGTSLARLAGTEAFWIQASLPVDQLRWIRFPAGDQAPGSPVTIRMHGGKQRAGTVLRYLPDLDTGARMARVLISVPDPLGQEAPGTDQQALLLNDYVSVLIEGEELKDVCRIPRTGLRDGNQLWLLGPDHTLHIQPVQVLWGTQDSVLIPDAVAEGWQLILSGLAAPVEGMTLRNAQEMAREPERKTTEAGAVTAGNDHAN